MTKTLKKLSLSLLSAACLFSLSAIQAEDNPDKRDYDTNLLIFTSEIDSFVEAASAVVDRQQAPESEIAATKDLIKNAERIADVYFHALTSEAKPAIDAYLGRVLKENQKIKNYFNLIGNAFIQNAQSLLEAQNAKLKAFKRWTTIGGAVVGVAVGGGYLYFRSRGAAGLALKDYMIAATAVVGFTAAGYATGAFGKSMLPVDRSVSNAKDFVARYPHGQDYIEEIQDGSQDLRDALADLEKGISDVAR